MMPQPLCKMIVVLLYCVVLLDLTALSVRSAPSILISADVEHCTGNHTGPQQFVCDSLDHAMELLWHFEYYHEVTVEFSCEEHNISKRAEFIKFDGITLKGQCSPSDVILECQPGASLSFVNSTTIRVENISLVGCGAKHNSTTQDPREREESFLKYQVALYFENCYDATIRSVDILNSNGTGLAFINSKGRIEVSQSIFNHSVASMDMPGGNGVYIEFSYVYHAFEGSAGKGLLHTDSYTSGSMYRFTECEFLENVASTGGIETTHITLQTEREDFVFGKGGGMSIYFGGDASDNYIWVDSSNFSVNMAEMGGGVFVHFADSSNNNKVHFSSVFFISNQCNCSKTSPNLASGGGGAKIFFTSNSTHNTIVFTNSNFSHNSAYQGGGLSLHAQSVLAERNEANITYCTFHRNKGVMGAAVDLHTKKPATAMKQAVVPTIADTSFNHNGWFCSMNNGACQSTLGALSIDHLSATLEGNVQFHNSKGSALVLKESTVTFGKHTRANFSRNTGIEGGAIALYGSSLIVLNEGTKLTFVGNEAEERGGAIYVRQSEHLFAAYSYSCFIQYSNQTLHPREWNTSLRFSRNLAAGKQNSFFANSILPCVWPSSINSSLEDDIPLTFCSWNDWIFEDSNCTDEILTSASKFNSTKGYGISVFPGWPAQLSLTVLDEFNHDVTNQTIFTISSDSLSPRHDDDSVGFQYVMATNFPPVNKPPNTSAVFQLQTVAGHTISTKVKVQMEHCPPGFAYNGEQCNCREAISSEGALMCDEGGHSSLVFVGYCISNSSVGGNDTVVLARCPFFAGLQAISPYIPLPQRVDQLDDRFCGSFDRTGKLCGSCIPGKGISVFSDTYNCTSCTDGSYKNWLTFFSVTFIPPTIFFLFVIVFHVGVTTGPANGFIFFSQVLTVPLQVLFYESGLRLLANNTVRPNVLLNLLISPYSIWSLDFYRLFPIDLCLDKSMKVAAVLALQYISAIYPLILLVLAYVLIELHARNFRLLVFLSRPFCIVCARFRRGWQADTSVIDAFATFILLSYSKFVRVSCSLLTPTSVITDSGEKVGKVLAYDPSLEFFRGTHSWYAVLALFVLFTFGALPPILLVFYQFKPFQKFLDCCRLRSHGLQTFVDAFQGCYKDGKDGGPDRRYFAGLYFLFRSIVFAIFTSTTSFELLLTLLAVVYLVFVLTVLLLRPYKRRFYTCLDALIFALLALINALVMYNYVTLQRTNRVSKHAFYLAYSLSFLPLLYIAGYVIYWMLCHFRYINTHLRNCVLKLRRQEEQLENEDLVSFHDSIEENDSTSIYPDRVLRPEEYEDVGRISRWHHEDLRGVACVQSLGEDRRSVQRQHGLTRYGATTW